MSECPSCNGGQPEIDALTDELAELRAALVKEKERSDYLERKLERCDEHPGIIAGQSDSIETLDRQLAAERQRADETADAYEKFKEAVRLRRFELDDERDALRAALAKEKERADRLETERDAWIGTNHKHRVERDALRAECERLKAELKDRKDHDALAAFFGGPGEESVNSAKRARAEREARITSLQTELNHEVGKGDLLREELGEREAAYKLADNDIVRIARERDEARAALATARDEALEDAAKVAEPYDFGDEPNVSEAIRALKGEM